MMRLKYILKCLTQSDSDVEIETSQEVGYRLVPVLGALLWQVLLPHAAESQQEKAFLDWLGNAGVRVAHDANLLVDGLNSRLKSQSHGL